MVQQNPKETDYSEHEVRQRATDMLITVLFVHPNACFNLSVCRCFGLAIVIFGFVLTLNALFGCLIKALFHYLSEHH